LGVIIKNQTKVSEVKQESVTLSSTEVLSMDFIIFAGGIEPNALVYKLHLDKNETGYISTNRYLQTQNYANVFAIGDCTTIYNKDKIVAPTADTAEQMAELCAKNIDDLINSKPLIEHNIKSRGILVALGRGYAVAKLFGFYFSGYPAYIIKKLVEKIYAKRLDTRSKKGCKKIFCD